MTTKLDYDGILQVHPNAEKEVIDAAYRKLAAKYHPDVSRRSDAIDRMKQINIAYEVLSDPDKRAAYDASRGVAPSSDAQPHTAHMPQQYRSKTWRVLLTTTIVVLIAVMVLRLGPALVLLVPKIVVPLVVIALVVWLYFTLVKPRR